ncbi:hypothetical protein E2562_013121 [Oryza meyeriana var. granulata]|uniref:Uncharacterized protein n=1 Tax=Oryza meyeriana var. granulata TaxID=110450 RepID=A0A6G1F7Z0_9ORYZ|nr:hypothetical protein E2562_013121 [Oryza meyeriana var. granulata]
MEQKGGGRRTSGREDIPMRRRRLRAGRMSRRLRLGDAGGRQVRGGKREAVMRCRDGEKWSREDEDEEAGASG